MQNVDIACWLNNNSTTLLAIGETFNWNV